MSVTGDPIENIERDVLATSSIVLEGVYVSKEVRLDTRKEKPQSESKSDSLTRSYLGILESGFVGNPDRRIPRGHLGMVLENFNPLKIFGFVGIDSSQIPLL